MVKLNALSKFYIEEYCELIEIKPMEHYKEKILSNSNAAFRKMLKQAIQMSGLTYPISTHSFRKYYANTIYKLHPQDVDNLMIVQTMMGHSDLETTKIYINEIDRKSDKYNNDYSKYMLRMKNGEKIEISNSPILSIVWEDARELFSK
ncbi:MAG: tyrosine-type recombinase/integrase [Lachnospiraceae bacterium]|nr:tyrosine-type recombinase/integrase [Lachnospiraceae bacterium]MDE6253625.1 tyrosine-type recombinase/integrase [Lachnospiraceae bacterium]